MTQPTPEGASPSEPDSPAPVSPAPVSPAPGYPSPAYAAPGDPATEYAVAPLGQPPVAKKKRGLLIATVSLGVVLLGVIAGGVWLFLQLDDARTQIDDQQREIREQKDEIEEQKEMIEKKEIFGAAMNALHDTIEPLAGLPFTTLVPWNQYDALATRAWQNRREPELLEDNIAEVEEATAKLVALQDAARVQASTNATGSAWESTLDSLAAGWVATSFVDASVSCGGDPIACVSGADPYIVQVDAARDAEESMTDWIRTGAAYHELAHVLQFTNPDPTATAVVAFGGDFETMADCYALTYLDGWTLDHEVWISDYMYYDVSVGYGYTCDDSQRQVIRDWASSLAIQMRPLGG